jgi:hypothetical protein
MAALTRRLIQSQGEAALTTHGIRMLGIGRNRDSFGDPVFKLVCHFMDVNNCGTLDQLITDLAAALNARVAFDDQCAEGNAILIKSR